MGNLVEILVPLTWPLETDQLGMYHSYLLAMKSAFAGQPRVFDILLKEIMSVLGLRNPSVKEQIMLRLMLVLVRNILVVRDGAVGVNQTTAR